MERRTPSPAGAAPSSRSTAGAGEPLRIRSRFLGVKPDVLGRPAGCLHPNPTAHLAGDERMRVPETARARHRSSAPVRTPLSGVTGEISEYAGAARRGGVAVVVSAGVVVGAAAGPGTGSLSLAKDAL